MPIRVNQRNRQQTWSVSSDSMASKDSFLDLRTSRSEATLSTCNLALAVSALNLRNSCVFSLSSASRRLILPSYLWTASFWLFSWSRRVSIALISSEKSIKNQLLLVENDEKMCYINFAFMAVFPLKMVKEELWYLIQRYFLISFLKVAIAQKNNWKNKENWCNTTLIS